MMALAAGLHAANIEGIALLKACTHPPRPHAAHRRPRSAAAARTLLL